MKRRIQVVATLVLTLIFSGLISGSLDRNSIAKAATASQKITDLRKQRDLLAREIERNKQAAEQKKKEAEKITQEVKKIDGDITSTESKIVSSEEQIKKIEEEIGIITGDIAKKENEITVQNSNQAESLRNVYALTDNDTFFLLAGKDSLSEAIDRSAYLESLEAQIEATVASLTEIKNDLVNQKKVSEDKQTELVRLKKQQETYKKGLEFSKRRKDVLLGQTKDAQKEYEKQVEEAKRTYADVNSELYKLQLSAQKRAIIRGGEKKVSNITWAWSFSGAMTTNFGEPTPIQSFHTGYDIDGVIGDSVLAAADGTVSFVGGRENYGYGNYIMIDHGQGISSLYGHLDGFAVSNGDTVKRGQVIGYMGNTGFAIAYAGGDGSHLHFEIREDGVPVNPGIYLP